MRPLVLLFLLALDVFGTPVGKAIGPEERSNIESKATQPQARGNCELSPVHNGDFESGSRGAWVIPSGSVNGFVKSPGSNYGGDSSQYSLRSDNLIDNNLFTVTQTLNTCAGFEYTCSYDWYFDAFYATKYRNGNTYVPYVHTYVNYDAGNHDAIGVRSLYRGQGKQWQRNSVSFTANGSDVLEFDLASPQPLGQGCNFARLDNINCVALAP